MQDGTIEIVPFEFMRGRTFHKSFVLLDEGQNCTFSDLKLLVTRTGDGSNVVIAGDVMQLDMDASESGLQRHIDMVDRHDLDADVIEFDAADVVRSKVVSEWVSAYRKDAGLS
jgi:phosphate starvation-inducible PhoH-like protein